MKTNFVRFWEFPFSKELHNILKLAVQRVREERFQWLLLKDLIFETLQNTKEMFEKDRCSAKTCPVIYQFDICNQKCL